MIPAVRVGVLLVLAAGVVLGLRGRSVVKDGKGSLATDPTARESRFRGESSPSERVELPEPDLDGSVSLERTLERRRSRRAFSPEAPDLSVVSQLAWAAQGVTTRDGRRTAPSAGALYPLELFVAAGDVEGLPDGLYRYLPDRHSLEPIRPDDVRSELSRAALDQQWIRSAPLVLVFGAVYDRTTRKYGERGRRYVQIEVGSAAQNVYLQAEADGWATVFVGAFQDRDVLRLIGADPGVVPLGIMPVGRAAR